MQYLNLNYLASKKEIFIFFLISLFIFAFPIILNNYHYIDDSWRTLETSNAWKGEGRFFASFLMNVITFSSGSANSFPLTMIMAIVIISVSLTSLLFHWIKQPKLIHGVVLLPLWCNPFLLQLLSYQYDCFTVSVALSLAIYSLILCEKRTALAYLGSILLIVIFLSIYQVTINFFIGLLALNAMIKLCEEKCSKKFLTDVVIQCLVLLVGIVIYYFTFLRALKNDRGGVILPTAAELLDRLELIFSHVTLFITPINFIFFLLPLLLALLQLARVVKRSSAKSSFKESLFFTLMLLLSVLAVLLAIPGIAILMKNMNYNSGARMLLGAGVAFAFILKLASDFLEEKNVNFNFIIILPLLVFTSFSYVYGGVMGEKKYNEEKLIQLIYSDIVNNKQVFGLNNIYVDMKSNRYSNIFPESCMKKSNPALPYVFESNYIFLTEQLISLGLWKVKILKDTPKDKGEVILDRPYWQIFKNSAGDGYIYFKNAPKKILGCIPDDT